MVQIHVRVGIIRPFVGFDPSRPSEWGCLGSKAMIPTLRGKTEMIVSISWVCDILCQFYLIVDYFLRFDQWRFPSF